MLPLTARPSLTSALGQLLHLSAGKGTTLEAMLVLLADRGVALLMVICTAPFLVPVTIPGLSTPFGAMLALCGLYTLLGRPVRLPRRLGRRLLPHASLARTVSVVQRVFGKIEHLLHPRWTFLVTGPRFRRLHGILTFLMALVLAMPFPGIPFVGSNAIAAVPIFLLGLGLLERDGLVVAIAYAWIIPFVLYWVFFYHAFLELFREIWPF